MYFVVVDYKAVAIIPADSGGAAIVVVATATTATAAAAAAAAAAAIDDHDCVVVVDDMIDVALANLLYINCYYFILAAVKQSESVRLILNIPKCDPPVPPHLNENDYLIYF